MIRAIIIEDQKPAQDLLKIFCARTGNIEVIEVFGSITDAQENGFLNSIEGKFDDDRYDFLFLDHQLPDLNGLDFLETYDTIFKKPVIIITAINTTAERIFNLVGRVIADFLKKPISYPRFEEAISRVKERLDMRKKTISVKISEKNNNKRDVVLDKTIILGDIVLIQATKQTQDLYLSDGSVLHTAQETGHSFDNLLKSLPDCLFRKISRSYCVNGDFIEPRRNYQEILVPALKKETYCITDKDFREWYEMKFLKKYR